jgi:hypothetical protein
LATFIGMPVSGVSADPGAACAYKCRESRGPAGEWRIS